MSQTVLDEFANYSLLEEARGGAVAGESQSTSGVSHSSNHPGALKGRRCNCKHNAPGRLCLCDPAPGLQGVQLDSDHPLFADSDTPARPDVGPEVKEERPERPEDELPNWSEQGFKWTCGTCGERGDESDIVCACLRREKPEPAWYRAAAQFGFQARIGALNRYPSAYLSNKMTGVEDYNFPWFRDVTRQLRSEGWVIKAPHEKDEEEGFDPKGQGEPLSHEQLMPMLRRDIADLVSCDCVIVGPDWKDSSGSRLEVHVARGLGLPVFAWPDLEVVYAGTKKDLPASCPDIASDLEETPDERLERLCRKYDLPVVPPCVVRGSFGGQDRETERLEEKGLENVVETSLETRKEARDRAVEFELDGKRHVAVENPKNAAARSEGRTRLDLLEPSAEKQIALALATGADKYGVRNFRNSPILARVYVAAMKRHLDAWLAGSDADSESGLHPLAHVGASVHVVLSAMDAGSFEDDRRGDG